MDRASYDGTPAYIIAVPSRVWVVRLGCTAADPQEITSVSLTGLSGNLRALGSVEGYASCCEAIAGLDVRDELARITAPTLVISGAEDHAIPPVHQEAIAAGIRGARLESIADAAHIPTVQHPPRVNELILEYIDL